MSLKSEMGMSAREHTIEGTIGSNKGWVKLAWWLSFALSLAIIAAALPYYFNRTSDAIYHGIYADQYLLENTSWHRPLNILKSLIEVFSIVISLILAWVLYRKRSRDRMVIFLSFFLLMYGVGVVGPLGYLMEEWLEITWIAGSLILSILFAPPFLALLFLFPDGRFVPPWTRWLLFLSVPVILMGYTVEFVIALLFNYSPGWIGTTWTAVFAIGASFAQIYRYRRVSGPVEKQQTKWVVYGLALMCILLGSAAVSSAVIFSLPPGSTLPWWVEISEVVYGLSFISLPLSLTIAVLGYRLYDIDLLINRTLVYGILTTFVVGAYVLVVSLSSLVFQSYNKVTGALLATVIVIILFKPLKATLQRNVDRLISNKGVGERYDESIKSSIDRHPDQGSTAPVLISGGWLRISRWAWVILATIAVGIFITSIPGYYYAVSNDSYADLTLLTPSRLNFAISLTSVMTSAAAALLSLTLAWVLYRKNSSERIVVLLSFFLLYYGVGFAGPIERLAYRWPEFSSKAFLITTSLMGPLMGPLLIAIIVLFPDGRFVPSWTRWLLLLSIPTIPLGYAFNTSVESVFASPLGWVSIFLGMVAACGALYAQIYRYRVVSGPLERQQTKWVVYGFSLMALCMLVTSVPYAQMQLLSPGSPSPWWASLSVLLWSVSLIFLPATLTTAILRFRLYDIDLIINRTLVYGILTACTMGIYVFSVGYIGNLLQTPDRSIIAFLTTGLVALLFQPFRERLQGIVNRMMYGDRDDPVAILTNLSKRLEATISPEAILPGLVETVAGALKLPYVAIEVYDGETGEVVAAYGEPQEELERFPLVHRAGTIGELTVACRAPGESFSESESRLLRNIAQQAGAAVHSIQLTRDLQQSRQRLVTAREEERRRLRRDLHDGLGPVLASQGLKIAAATELLDTDPQKARQMLEELNVQNEETVVDIRRLVYALRPSSLDELGLVGAVRDYAVGLNGGYLGSSSTRVNVRAPQNGLPPLPAAVEVAAYRIATEALTNVFRHSQAKHCSVSFLVESSNGMRTLLLEVKDDGSGLAHERKPGVGLTTMRERAEELSGSFQIESVPKQGTRVIARLPLVD